MRERRRLTVGAAAALPGPLAAFRSQLLEGGRLTIEGGGYAVATKIDAPIGDEEVVDAAGNVTVVQRKKELTGRDLRKAEKAKAKDRKTRAKRGEEVTDDEEE